MRSNKMGLDMYLKAEIYVSKRDKENEVVRKIFPEMFTTDNLDFIDISFECGYWRKANQIHKWFVDNVQDGEDECKTHDVSREDLEKLRELCVEITKDKTKAKELLPPEEGLFFGGKELDEYYFEDIKNTIAIIDKCLKLSDKWEFKYRSSW